MEPIGLPKLWQKENSSAWSGGQEVCLQKEVLADESVALQGSKYALTATSLKPSLL